MSISVPSATGRSVKPLDGGSDNGIPNDPGRPDGPGGGGGAGGASPSGSSPAPAVAKPKVAPGKRVEPSMWDKIVIIVKVVLGISTVNDTPYTEYLNDLNSKHDVVNSVTDVNARKNRAQEILNSTQDIFELATANVANSISNKEASEPWLGVTESSGVPMSGTLTHLGSTPLYRNREAYYHNISLRNWAQAVKDGKKVISFVDKDNTSTSKALDPSDVVLAQSNERLFWGSAILRYYGLLGADLNTNTARAIASSRIQLSPEGILKSNTVGMLDSALREQGGLLNLSQLNASDILGIIAFNSGVQHKPGRKTMITPELAKTTEFFKDMMASDAPRVNDKRLIEAISDLANGKGYSVLEPKPIPMYMRRMYVDTHAKGDPEVYFPHYLKIIELKERIVDSQIPNGDEHSDPEIRKAWTDFRAAVYDNASDDRNEVDKDKIWLTDGLKEMLDENPQQFYEYSTKAALSAIVFHHFNNHGTPIENTKRDFVGILEDFSNSLEVRKNIAFLHKQQANATARKDQGHRHVFDFHNRAREVYVNDGVIRYAEWRACQYLMHRHSKDDLLSLKSQFGTKNKYNLFEHDEITNELRFSDEFRADQQKTPLYYSMHTLVHEMNGNELTSSLNKDILTSFFAEQGDGCRTLDDALSRFINYEGDYDSSEAALSGYDTDTIDQIFYPNELYLINNANPYHPKAYNYATMLNVVLKMDQINKDGQYYIELQPPGEKHLSLPQFSEFISFSDVANFSSEEEFYNAKSSVTGIGVDEFNKILESNATVHVGGDSKGDVTMMARALELGGFIDVVLNQISDDDIFSEIIKQRLQYREEFTNEGGFVDNELYQACRKKFAGEYGHGMCALVQDKDTKLYYKVDRYEYNKGESVPVLMGEGLTKQELLLDLREEYTSKICRNASPEAFMRRQVEVFGHLTGRNIEFKQDEYLRAKSIYLDKIKGKTSEEIASNITPEEQELFFLYEYAVIREVEGNSLPDEAPQHNVRNLWVDPRGKFEVYRSTEHDGKLMKFTTGSDGSVVAEEYTGSLDQLHKHTIVTRFHERGFAIHDPVSDSYSAYDNYDKINKILVENELVKRPSESTDFIFNNKWLVNTFGKDKLKKFVAGFPGAFQKLLNASGSIMALGGLTRLLSPIFGDTSAGEGVFKAGYYMSNGLRAVSAFGGALRGYLNVNKYWPIPLGEGVNIVASFLPDGIKHGFLGLGNFILFEGRALQAAQRQQRINNPATEILKVKNDDDPELLESTINKYVDPRETTREVTKLNTDITNAARKAAEEAGIPGGFGEVMGSFGGALLSGAKMVKDVVKDPRLIFQRSERLAEKSGGAEKVIASPGHLMGVVGAISGVGTLAAALFGRSERFGEVQENGFNGIGRWAISAACAIPAIGIIFNALEVASNPEGLPKMYNGLNGKDAKYDPFAAGTNQLIAGFGFLIVPWFNLSNKFTAALYDVFNGIYFRGAAHEEGPNSHRLFLSMFRSNNQLYNEKPTHRNISFEQAA